MLTKLRHAITPGNDPATPSSSMGSDFVTLDGNDNETAAEVLAPYLERHGVRVVRRNGQNVSARRGSSKIILSPKVSGDGIDREFMDQSMMMAAVTRPELLQYLT